MASPYSHLRGRVPTSSKTVPSKMYMDFVARDSKPPYLKEKYDYLRCTVGDLNGLARGKVIPYKQVEKTLQNGLSIYAGILYIGPNGELPRDAVSAITADGEPNVIFDADVDTFSIHKHEGGYVTAEIYGSLKVQKDGVLVPSPYGPSPRDVALNQLRRLEELGMYLIAGYEIEFCLLQEDKGEVKPLFQNYDVFNQIMFGKYDHLLFEMEKLVPGVEGMACEYGPGQFEFALKPTEGITTADNVFQFKYKAREWCMSQGQSKVANLSINFMSKPFTWASSSGAHFNHSLWKTSTHQNMFADKSDPEGLSLTAKHWVAGLVEHADALTALCCPTYNCYRRLHRPWAPDTASWGLDDRETTFRVVNKNPATTYVENRTPSMAANPYIVMAATVAAGLDGIARKLECPPRGKRGPKVLAKDLGEALEALRKDDIICKALGEDFIKMFIDCKTELEWDRFKHHDPSSMDEEQFTAERNMYEHFI